MFTRLLAVISSLRLVKNAHFHAKSNSSKILIIWQISLKFRAFYLKKVEIWKSTVFFKVGFIC